MPHQLLFSFLIYQKQLRWILHPSVLHSNPLESPQLPSAYNLQLSYSSPPPESSASISSMLGRLDFRLSGRERGSSSSDTPMGLCTSRRAYSARILSLV